MNFDDMGLKAQLLANMFSLLADLLEDNTLYISRLTDTHLDIFAIVLVNKHSGQRVERAPPATDT